MAKRNESLSQALQEAHRRKGEEVTEIEKSPRSRRKKWNSLRLLPGSRDSEARDDARDDDVVAHVAPIKEENKQQGKPSRESNSSRRNGKRSSSRSKKTEETTTIATLEAKVLKAERLQKRAENRFLLASLALTVIVLRAVYDAIGEDAFAVSLYAVFALSLLWAAC